MADYWKSIPRKFCDFCKCWLTDNKPSIEFHERGRKHQDNVRKKIFELRRKGQKAFQEEKNTERMMKRIEQAALKAFQKDVANNPDMSAKSGNYPVPATVQLPPVQDRSEIPTMKPKKSTNTKQNKKNKNDKTKKIKVWFEAKTEDDSIYYWNSETGESSWDKPTEGYISIREQEQPETSDFNSPKPDFPNLTSVSEESSSSTVEPLKIENPPALSESTTEENLPATEESQTNLAVTTPSDSTPQPAPVVYNRNPYGSWTTVITRPVKTIDLQLPKKEKKPEYTVVVPADEPQIKFEEKIVTSIANRNNSNETGFKKRKPNGGFKRNIRQKVDDDEEES